jgi:hypothetical protein
VPLQLLVRTTFPPFVTELVPENWTVSEGISRSRRDITKARKRRKFTDHFKAQAALEALRGGRTVQEIAARHTEALRRLGQ